MNTKEKSVKSCNRECLEWVKRRTIRTLNRGNHSGRGFTLVELIVVTAVIGVLALMALPAFSDMKTRAKIGRCAQEIRSLEKDIIAYAADNGVFPNNLNVVNRGDLRDPWGSPYVYVQGGGVYLDRSGIKNLNNDFDLYSKGEDGDSHTDLSEDPGISMDDIIRGGDGAEVSLAKDY